MAKNFPVNFSEKKEEDDRKIEEALKARGNRSSTTSTASTSSNSGTSSGSYAERKKDHDAKIEAAMTARSERIQKDWSSILDNINRNMSLEIDRYNKTKQPAYGSYNETYNSQSERRFNISSLRTRIKAYSSYMDTAEAERYLAALDDLEKGYDSHLFLSKFESEDSYNAFAAQQKDYEEKSSFDIAGGEKEIKHLESVLEDYKMLTRFVSDEKGALRADQIRQQYGDENAIKQLIAQKKQYLNQAKRIQEGITLSGVAGNDDFKEFSGYKTTQREKTEWWQSGTGDTQYEWINNQGGFRDQWESEMADLNAKASGTEGFNTSPEESYYTQKGYDLLTESEIAIYNYYYAKEGREKAQEYLDNIQETLNHRKATQMFADMEGNTALELLFGVEAGLDQFASGLTNVFNTKDDYIAQSAYQIASGMVREDLADDSIPMWYNVKTGKWEDKIFGSSLGQVGYDAITTTANMAPSILASIGMNIVAPGSGAVVGNVLMGASAAGNAYQEALNQGFDKSQARVYSSLVGGSEAILGELLGGISKLGGTSKAIAKALDGVDNGFLRFIGKLGGSMISEGIEEGLQEVLNPLLSNAIMYTDEDVNWSEVAYSALLGSLSAGILEGPSTVASEVNTYRAGKRLQSAGVTSEQLANLGKTFSADTVAYRLAGRVDENTGAYTLGRLFNEIGATMTEQNVSEITNALVEAGIPESIARDKAQLMAKIVEGATLTEEGIRAIEEDTLMSKAVKATIIDPNATWFQRTKGYNDALMALAQEKTTGKTTVKASEENVSASDKVDTQNENGSESLSEADAPKKAVRIANLDNGQVTVAMEDGSSVNLSDADIDPDDAVRIETIAGIEGISADDANYILGTLRAAPGTTAQVDSLGAKEAYRYGYYGFTEDHIAKNGVFANSLTESQRKAIYKAGQDARAKHTAEKQATVAKNATADKTDAVGDKSATTGRVHFDGDRNSLKGIRKESFTAMEKIAESLGIQIYVFESYVKQGKRVYKDKNGVEKNAPNGWYDPKTSSIHIDLNSGAKGEGVMLFTLAHELTHHIRKWSPAKFKILADFLMEEYGKKGVNVEALIRMQMDKAKRNGRTISYDTAYEEVVADSMEAMLADGNVMNRVEKLKAKDESLWKEIKRFVNEFAEKIRKAYKGMTPDSVEGMLVSDMGKAVFKLQELFSEALVDATENYQSFLTMEETTDVMPVEEGTQYSYRSLAEAAGFEAVENEDGTRSFMRNGVKVSEVTVDDIEHSPIGAFINYSLAKNDISAAEAKRQKKMFAEICTMACKTNDFSMTMQFVGSAVFTGMKANADKQYGTTYDFPSICTKTQAVIDAMSKRMVKLGRGLSSEELVKLYQDVFASGNPVPCPECYVFSRWIGIGGLLDNIKKYQDYYGDMSVDDVAKAYRTMRDQVAAFAEEQGISFGKAKGALTSKLTKEYNKLTEKIEKAENQGEKVKPADRKRLEELEPMMNTVKGMTWLENVYFADSSLKKVNPRFRVPDEVLFDLNNGEAFATKYKEAWAFRTTQGAGYGKAITPYAEARLGEGVLVTNNTTNAIKGKAQGSLDNFFLRQKGTLDKKAREALDRARLKQKIQAFIGGQRFQSTSDARYENASDYLLAALEMQAMHGMVQVYTKVDGAVPALAAWNYSINQSLMPLGGGLDANGNVRDTSVGGMNRDIAFRNREKFETAGTITIGVNDNHIRAMFKQWVRDFIIPYHASGGKADVVAAFRSIQEGQEKRGQMVRSTDYSRTQGDKVLSDEVLRWQGKTEAEIQRIHAVRDARIAILTSGKPNMDVVRSNRFLSALYDKLTKGGEWEGVKLAKSKVESQIFPNEFWDQSVSYEDSGKITRDYLEYCNDLGFLHRFSGLVPSNGKLVSVKGYDQNGERVVLTDLAYQYDENGQKTDQIEDFFWKVLTDRRMYDNEGKYLPQKVVTLKDTTEETVTNFAKGNYGRQYDKELSMKTAEEIAGKLYSDRDSQGNQLSEDQVEFFENSKARDENGNLYVMYHGSRSPLFTEFDMYEGVWLTPDQRYAEVYAETWRSWRDDDENLTGLEQSVYADPDYRVYKMYANITNPLDLGEINDEFDRKQMNRLARLLGVPASRIRNISHHDGYQTVGYVYEVTKDHEFIEIAKEKGYDGFVASERGRKTFCAFNAPNQVKLTTNEVPSGFYDIRYSDRVTDKETLNFLNEQLRNGEVTEVYRAMAVDGDRNLYPPMAGYVRKNGKKIINGQPSVIGEWEQSTESIPWESVDEEFLLSEGFKHFEAPTKDYPNGRFERENTIFYRNKKGEWKAKFHLDKDNGSTVDAAYAPYIHTSLSVLNDQFTSAYTRDNLVVVKGYVPNSEINGVNGKRYQANFADKPVGKTKWHSGVVAAQMPETRTVILSRYFMPIEIVDDAVMAQKTKEMMKGKDIEIPFNVVTPRQRRALEEIGVRIGEARGLKDAPKKDDVKYSDRDTESVSNRSLLANAFEGVAQNDIERNKIREYRSKIDLIEAEERKLRELNQKIKDLSFSKGPKDTKAIKDLQFEAKQASNRINTYDSQLLRLEASKPLQAVLAREKQKAYKRAEKKGKEALEAYRERAAKTQRELMDRYQDARKRNAENREKTAMRHKIQNVVKELNDLLLNESKKRHVPDNLKKAVAEALALVNMDTVGAEERAAKYAALIAKETDPDKIDAYTATMENILRQGEKMGQRLKELRDAYEEIQESDDPDIANAYDPVIAGSLKELSQSIGNTSLRDMTIEQLSDVYDMYKMVLTRVRDANKTLLENIKENISSLASRVIGEVRMTGGDHKYRMAALDPVRKFLWNNLKPVYAMEHIGSSTLTKVFNNVRAGEDTWAKDVTEAREYYLDKADKYGYNGWDFDKKYRFQSASELEFELTLEQILSLYAYSKREQAHDHLRLGGFVFDSNIETYKENGGKLKYKVNTADAHQITPEILASIIGKLSKEQMAFVDEMQDYLSTVMGAKGNEVTMKMYGVKLFKEKFYFPLKSAKQFMFEQNEVSGEVRIKNSGFTNKVVAKANNPVILSNFMDVWSGHVNDMSMYHSFVLPLEDFNRVFNYNSPKQENQPSVSVKGTIQNAYSPAAVNYVKGLITDLNGGARSDSTTGIINKMMGLFKKGSVFASLSVVVQQPSAIARAAALVDTKYFIGPKVDHKRHKLVWDEVKRYAPVAIIKEMGYFDTNMGKSTQDFILGKEYSGFKDKMKALVTDSGYRDEILSKAPALADEMAWCSIWEAVKREMHDQYKGLDVKSEPFLMLCGSRFTEVITKTQVYDSVLSRSANMRSKDTGMKMATAFMAEPTTSINMIADALLQGKRGNKKYARAAIGAVIASQIFNSILVSFVYAGRDDDEDKTYWEKYIGTLTGEVIDSLNPAGYIPFIKDIMSIVQGYDVERSDMAVISDLWNAYKKLGNDNLSVYRKVEGFAGSIAQIFGLPVKNIMRDVRGIWQTIESFMSGQQTTKAGIGYAVKESLPKWLGGGDTSNQKQLYEAYLRGDQAQIARVESRYEDEKAVHTAMRSAIKEHFVEGDINAQTALSYLVKYAGMEEDDAYWKVEEWEYENETGEDFGKYNEFFTAVETGKNLKAVIKQYTDNGVELKTLSSQITSHFKPIYGEMTTSERASIKGYLLNAFEQLGVDRDDATNKLQYWEFLGEQPDSTLTQYQIADYYEFAKPAGISADLYSEYCERVKDITGDGKKDRRMAVIDSLPITSAQKDALYFAEGWAESRLHEAPWH